MIKATGREDALQLSIDGAPIALLDHAKLGFTLKGKSYAVRRMGFFAPVYTLLRDDEALVSIRQSPFVNRFTVISVGRMWTLKAENMRATCFGLFDGDARVGGITPAGRYSARDVTIDLPDEVPLAAQVFLMWLVLWKWSASST